MATPSPHPHLTHTHPRTASMAIPAPHCKHIRTHAPAAGAAVGQLNRVGQVGGGGGGAGGAFVAALAAALAVRRRRAPDQLGIDVDGGDVVDDAADLQGARLQHVAQQGRLACSSSSGTRSGGGGRRGRVGWMREEGSQIQLGERQVWGSVVLAAAIAAAPGPHLRPGSRSALSRARASRWRWRRRRLPCTPATNNGSFNGTWSNASSREQQASCQHGRSGSHQRVGSCRHPACGIAIAP